MTTLKKMKTKSLLDQSLASAFPDVDPGERPLGSLVLLQVKRAATKTVSGFILPEEAQKTEFDNTQVAKVIALGVLAFHSRDTGLPWPEGAWVKVGDYVRISQHNLKTWTVPIPGTGGKGQDERVTFAYIDDLHLAGEVDDPLAVKGFF